MTAPDWLLIDWTRAGPGVWAALGVVALAAALSALWLAARLAPGARASLAGGDEPALAFLFDGETLVDATPPARRLLAAAPEDGSDWHRLMLLLLPRFPEIETRLEALEPETPMVFPSLDRDARLTARWRSHLVRLAIEEEEPRESPVQMEAQGLRAMETEISTLRAVTDTTPCLVWRQTRRGRITWANRAYLETVTQAFPGARRDAWPPPALFTTASLMTVVDGAGTRRLSITPAPGHEEIWFDLTSADLGEEVLFVAQDASPVVQAEGQLRDFTSILNKTFAHITIGLAIFDRSRQLVLFNPALTELTGLPVEFLAGRPTLFGFLDRLRDTAMMPEPRDYKSWRGRLMELEAAAESGTYAETWSLPSGQTYRVSGQPHPDGAVAFLFENISSEISLTRRFRSELEMGQAVIDSLDEAIAVFSGSGVLAMSNKAYEALWGDDPGTSLRDITVADATRGWEELCAPTRFWNDVRDFAARARDRAPWSGEVHLRDGRGLIMRVAPLAGGATLVSFRAVYSGSRLASDPDEGGLPPQLRAQG